MINFGKEKRSDDILERNFMGRTTFALFNTSFASEGILEGRVEVRGPRVGTLIYYEVYCTQGFSPGSSGTQVEDSQACLQLRS